MRPDAAGMEVAKGSACPTGSPRATSDPKGRSGSWFHDASRHATEACLKVAARKRSVSREENPTMPRPGPSVLVLVALILTVPLVVSGATVPGGFSETQVASGLAQPTTMAFAPDGRLFVALQGGALRVIKNGALLPTPFLTVPVDATGERGLLGVAFDPAFATNSYVYVYYTATAPA